MLQRFGTNLAIGLILYLICLMPQIQHNPAVQNSRDAVISWQMNRLVGIGNTSSLAWIDIDQAAHVAWGVPYQTPRDKLLKLIRWAAAGKPAAIVVDIDLTYPLRGYAGDAALANYLAGYQRCTSCAPLILVRTLEPSPYYDAPGRHAVEAQRSFLDSTLHTSPDNPWNAGSVRWGTSGMDRDPDGIVRRWRVWEDSCNAPKQAAVLPSVILLASAAATQTNPAIIQNALAQLKRSCARNRAASERLGPASKSRVTIDGYPLDLTEADLQRRVFYRITWSEEGGASGLDVGLPADEIVRNPQLHASAAKRLLDGRIVVIGASNEASGDLWVTPVGLMPGTVVMINAIDSVVAKDTIREPPAAVKVGLDLLLIVVVSALFALEWKRWLALSAALAVTLLLTFGVGLYLFNLGIWVDSIVPILGIFAHEILESIREMRKAGTTSSP